MIGRLLFARDMEILNIHLYILVMGRSIIYKLIKLGFNYRQQKNVMDIDRSNLPANTSTLNIRKCKVVILVQEARRN